MTTTHLFSYCLSMIISYLDFGMGFEHHDPFAAFDNPPLRRQDPRHDVICTSACKIAFKFEEVIKVVSVLYILCIVLDFACVYSFINFY